MKLPPKNSNGFTIIELIVIIVVLAILVTVAIFGYGTWRKDLAEKEIKQSLSAAATAMENERNFENTYPTLLPSSFHQSDTVKVSYVSGDDKKFCLVGTPADKGLDLKMHITNKGDVLNGDCNSN